MPPTTKSAKTSPALLTRFTGRNGKQRFIEAICRQELVASNLKIANKLAAVATRHEFPANHCLLTQGGLDTDLYLILSGAVSVKVNGREIATRTSQQHIGEMALLDVTAKRSASVHTTEQTVVAKIDEVKFSRIANDHPDLWRRIALALASRLRERNKFHKLPRTQPAVFIGSSSEGLEIVNSLHKSLSRKPYVVKPWTQGVFECSKTTIEDLMLATQETDFAVLVLTADDMTKSRGTKKASPRDNVIFELGLFMGALGRERTYIVAPKGVDIKIPTDLFGVNRLQFQLKRGRSISRNLQSVAKQLCKLINKYGPI